MSPKEKDTKPKNTATHKEKVTPGNESGLDAEISETPATGDNSGAEEPTLLTADLQTERHDKSVKNSVLLLAVIISLIAGAVGGAVGGVYLPPYFLNDKGNATNTLEQTLRVDEQSGIVDVVSTAEPAVVSIIVSKDLPRVQQFYFDPFNEDGFFELETPEDGLETQQVGAGSGFIATSDGMIITNRHVVADESADYTVVTSDGQSYSAEVLARDPLNDLAVVKIDQSNLPTIPLGDSENVKLGSRVVAIGNALGELSNTVTSGIISGIGRTISANDSTGGIQRLDEVFQTDAAINPGNSGGPLLNLAGQVIGINTAIDRSGQLVGFAIPSNEAKKVLEDVIEHGRILRPYLGIRYILITESYAQQNNLPLTQGAFLLGNSAAEPAVEADSPAENAGLVEGDIITEINGKQIDTKNTIVQLLKDYDPGEEVVLTVRRGEENLEIILTLAERQ